MISEYSFKKSIYRKPIKILILSSLCLEELAGWRNWFGAGLVSLRLRTRTRLKLEDFNDVKNRLCPCRMVMQHVKKSFECLIRSDALGKMKFFVQFRIVRAQVPPSGANTGRQNYIMAIDIYLDDAAIKSDTSSREMY
ncbi:hypothetical protein TNCV_4082171 [Trichonephila clavipes]|nr:hypothetical protein TNCV_4082171 [Trichonephila clavipes]